MVVGRARLLKERKKQTHIERQRERKRERERERESEEGWMLSCIDPSSPPSVTSLTYSTNGDVMIRLSFDHRR